MRFVFVSTMSGYPWGGSEELWSRTAARLFEASHFVAASVVQWSPQPPRILELAKKNMEIHYRRPMNQMSIVQRVGQVLRRQVLMDASVRWMQLRKPDLVVISQGGNGDGLAWMRACRDARIPYAVIVQCNSDSWWFVDKQVEEIAGLYQAARKIFCVSTQNLRLLELQLGRPLPNGAIVRNPFNVSSISYQPWPDESERWKFACVARLEAPAKGQDLILETLNHERWRTRPIEINFYGTGTNEIPLKRWADRLSLRNVRFHGQVGDIESVWRENHMLLLPSRYEGLPLALVEAMICGRPSIVTDVGGNVEFCEDEVTGFVASAPAVKLIDEAMERAWERRDQWRPMGMSAHKRALRLIPKDPILDFSKLVLGCAKEHPSAC